MGPGAWSCGASVPRALSQDAAKTGCILGHPDSLLSGWGGAQVSSRTRTVQPQGEKALQPPLGVRPFMIPGAGGVVFMQQERVPPAQVSLGPRGLLAEGWPVTAWFRPPGHSQVMPLL